MDTLIGLLLLVAPLCALFLLLSLIDMLLAGWDRRGVWIRRWGVHRNRSPSRNRRRPGALALGAVMDRALPHRRLVVRGKRSLFGSDAEPGDRSYPCLG